MYCRYGLPRYSWAFEGAQVLYLYHGGRGFAKIYSRNFQCFVPLRIQLPALALL